MKSDRMIPNILNRLTRRNNVIIILILALFSVGICWYYASCIEPQKLILKQQKIDLHQWGDAWQDFRILLIADIHARKENDAGRLENIIRMAESTSPDLILLLGDYGAGYCADQSMLPGDIAGFLSRLKARHGVYAILGNHDWVHNPLLFRQALENAGITVLENESRIISCGTRGDLELCGLPDYGTREHLYHKKLIMQKNDRNIPALAMTHNPLPFYKAMEQLPYDLTVSGHTHGGQISLPLWGPVKLMWEYRFYRLLKGLKRSKDGRQIYVTSGLGNSIFNMRMGNVPEMVLLTVNTRSGSQSN